MTPRAPLELPGSPGYHWYLVPRVGYPDPDSFQAARAALAELHDELWQRTGIAPARTVLGGFSMGAVMSYAMAFDAARPAPAGVLAFSGFIPTVAGWQPDLDERSRMRAFVAHGRQDRVIAVEFARAAVERLRDAGYPSTTTSPTPATTSIRGSCRQPAPGCRTLAADGLEFVGATGKVGGGVACQVQR